MNLIRRWIRNWLGFSRKETNGFLILLPLVMLILFSEPLYRLWLSNQADDFTKDEQKLDSLIAAWDKPDDSVNTEPLNFPTISSAELKPFDPNKTSVEELQKLGFSKNLSTRIAHYRQKGGVFRVKSDLMKIYGMDSSLYVQLHAYILLPEYYEKVKKDVAQFTSPGEKKNLTFDINTADTTQLKNINGIGSTLAKRIIKFRDGLGGFISLGQLNEVYGLDSTVINRLNHASYVDKNFEPKKINMNAADEKMLSDHPYIKRMIAKAIVAYRFQHGTFKTVNDIRNIQVIGSSEADKLAPYLKVTD
jgi:competence protein ComEA